MLFIYGFDRCLNDIELPHTDLNVISTTILHIFCPLCVAAHYLCRCYVRFGLLTDDPCVDFIVVFLKDFFIIYRQC